jgi:hypothetical protein
VTIFAISIPNLYLLFAAIARKRPGGPAAEPAVVARYRFIRYQFVFIIRAKSRTHDLQFRLLQQYASLPPVNSTRLLIKLPHTNNLSLLF